jgi:hypothetical protein
MNRITPKSRVRVDNNNYLYVDEVKVAKFDPIKHCLQFIDKDHIRSNQRGSNVVEITLTEIANLVKKE